MKTKSIILILLIIRGFYVCSAQTQIEQIALPLDIMKGLPFKGIEGGDLLIDGFDVDENGLFYLQPAVALYYRPSDGDIPRFAVFYGHFIAPCCVEKVCLLQ